MIFPALHARQWSASHNILQRCRLPRLPPQVKVWVVINQWYVRLGSSLVLICLCAEAQIENNPSWRLANYLQWYSAALSVNDKCCGSEPVYYFEIWMTCLRIMLSFWQQTGTCRIVESASCLWSRWDAEPPSILTGMPLKRFIYVAAGHSLTLSQPKRMLYWRTCALTRTR